MSTRSRAAAVLLSTLLAGPAVLTGCGGEAPSDATASTATASASGGAGSPAAATPTSGSPEGSIDAPPFPADTEPDTAEASSDSMVTVSDIRVGSHDGFDRVVFEVGGTGTPGWDVRYVDQGYSQGSGDPVDVDGQAVLQVTLTGAGYPFDTGVEEYAVGPVSVNTPGAVTEVHWDGTFEGSSVAFVGTAAEAPFRVYELADPTRVVLEIARPG